ncbi:MAG: diadenylate cyclase CdaA [Bacteroidales bacterium]|nr:diadenylate cyclase CdaA [Bacteroidales bacterium]
MVLSFLDFMHISLVDVIDMLLVAVIIFLAFRWIRGSSAFNIFIAVISLCVISVVVSALNMRLMTALMKTLLDVGVIALIVIFQPEVRKFLISLGSRYKLLSKAGDAFAKSFGRGRDAVIGSQEVNEIVEACRAMSRDKVGALIVFRGSSNLEDIMNTGDRVDALISSRLIRNLFFKNSPLHDGAMVIGRNRILAARCTLPITERDDIPANYGMRHKAAVGISEKTDATVIVVSEETGEVSYIKSGEIKTLSSASELHLILNRSLAGDEDRKEKDNRN